MSNVALNEMYSQITASGVGLPVLSSLDSVTLPVEGVDRSFSLFQAPTPPFDDYIHVSASDRWYGKSITDWLAHRAEWDDVRDIYDNDNEKAEIELLMLSNEDKAILHEQRSNAYTIFGLTEDHLSILDDYSDNFVEHRAEFLYLHLNPDERYVPDEFEPSESTAYIDLETGQKYRGNPIANIEEVFFGSNDGEVIRLDQEWHSFLTSGNQIVYGKNGDDVIYSGDGDDILDGGAGDDKLVGQAGADYMAGGEGDDTYIAGDGDTIFDTDGFGRVIFGDTVLSGGISSGNSNVYQSQDGNATYTLVDNTLTVTGDAGTLTIQNFNNLDLGIVLENTQPAPSIDPIGLLEGESSSLILSLGQPAGENGATYELQVSNPDYLTLSGAGVELLDAASGRYRVSVVAGASTLTLQAHALADDGNNIVNAVSLSVNEVIYTQNGQSEPGRQLTQVDLIIDDAHYDPSRAVHDYNPSINESDGGMNMTGGDPDGVLTYFHGTDVNDLVFNAGELTRTYAGGGDDLIKNFYTYDGFDGSTLEEIAAYWNQIESDYAIAWQWAVDNRAQRDSGDFNDWSEGGAGDDHMYGRDGEDYLDGGDGKDYLNGGGADYIFGDAGTWQTGDFPGDENWIKRKVNALTFCSLSA